MDLFKSSAVLGVSLVVGFAAFLWSASPGASARKVRTIPVAAIESTPNWASLVRAGGVRESVQVVRAPLRLVSQSAGVSARSPASVIDTPRQAKECGAVSGDRNSSRGDGPVCRRAVTSRASLGGGLGYGQNK